MLNKVELIGRLGKDPVIRYTASGEAVANVSLATTESWKNKAGEKQEKTEWHNLVFYRGLAEVVSEYLKKRRAPLYRGQAENGKVRKRR